MKLLNPFRVGLVGALGVLVALAIGGAVTQLATILTYVGAAIFLALGLDPIISMLQKRKVPRALAMVLVLLVILGVVAALVLAVVPVIVDQTTQLVNTITDISTTTTWQQFVDQAKKTLPGVPVQGIIDNVASFLSKNAATITSTTLSVGLGIVTGIGGAAIVIILTLYFAASLPTFKRALYRLVPMTKRDKFADIAEQIFQSVGRYVIGQVSLALVNGVLSFVFLSIVGAKLPAVFAFIAFIGSLIPLVGTISGAVLIFLGQLLLVSNNPALWITVGVYYLVYMQVEAYILSPNIMNRAVRVPGVVVVIAALTGGTLLGILGALIAIPVAAAIIIIIEQVVIPRQNEL